MSQTLLHALALALLVPGSAAAQTLGARITAGGGMDMVLYDGSTYVPGYMGQLGLEWRPVGSRGAFRLGLMHYQQNRVFATQSCGADLECSRSQRVGITGLNMDGTFDLTRGRLRPYVLSGLGVYRYLTVREGSYRCTSVCMDPARPPYSYRTPVWTGGLHSGVGLSANLGKTTAFTEFKILLMATDGRQARAILPLTLGLKF